MTHDHVRALKLGDLVRYHGADYAVELVNGDDPTPSVKLVGLPYAIYPWDLEALPGGSAHLPAPGSRDETAPEAEAPAPESIETPSA